MCKGCYSCVMRGEGKCPIKDDRNIILSEITEADGVIFSSPAYSHMVSSLMKNFYDRFGYLAHRPQFFDKYSMSLTTGAGYGAEFANRYMNKMSRVFGFEVVPPLDLNFRPGKQSEKALQYNKLKTIKAVRVFLSSIEKGVKAKPTLKNLVPFHIFKLVSELDSKAFIADYNYYKDKKEYYFDVQISPLKTFLAKRVARKQIFG